MWTAEIWLGARRKSAHANTAQMTLSMCSSRYCSSFALSFFYFLGCRCFFEKLRLFLFLFLDIFSSLRSTKEVTTKNMSLNRWKTWPMEFSEDVLEIDKNLVTTKRGSCDHFLTKIKISDPIKEGDGRIRNFFDWFWYMEHRNPSSYAKTRPVLRTDSELEDKTGTMRAKLVSAVRIWWKQWRQV